MSDQHINRFLGRAAHYDRYRPTYANELFDYLRQVVPFGITDRVADIAAGTGILTERMADWGLTTYVVEPNAQMMARAKHRLHGNTNCIFSSGTAEVTGLASNSVKLILAAQAFHWFEAQKAKVEFQRIGVKDAFTGIIWNKRRTDSPFEQGYENILQIYGEDYLKVSHSAIGQKEIDDFFSPSLSEYRVFPHTDWLTREAVRGRIASYSFMPRTNAPKFKAVESALYDLFDANEDDGLVSLAYETKLHLGQL